MGRTYYVRRFEAIGGFVEEVMVGRYEASSQESAVAQATHEFHLDAEDLEAITMSDLPSMGTP